MTEKKPFVITGARLAIILTLFTIVDIGGSWIMRAVTATVDVTSQLAVLKTENENIKSGILKIYNDNSAEHKDIIEKVDLQSSKIDTLMGKVDVMLDIKNAPKTGCLVQ